MHPFFRTTLLLLAVASAAGTNAQNRLSISRIGKDRIAVYNPNAHSIAVSIQSGAPLVIAPYNGITTAFSLDNDHVAHTPFSSCYNEDCLRLDLAICRSSAARAIDAAGDNAWRKSIFNAFLQGTNLGIAKDIVGPLFSDDPDLLSEILAAYQSRDPYEQKMDRLNKIYENFEQRKKNIHQAEDLCLSQARQELETNKTCQTYYAAQFISRQENFRFELSPFYVLGFNPRLYKNVKQARKSFSQFNANKQLPLGIRACFNFNAYNRYRQRKTDKKVYLVLEYSQSPALYKTKADPLFAADTAYAWNFYSAGFGWETLFRNPKGQYNSSFSFELGAVGANNFRYPLDSGRHTGLRQANGSLKEFNLYAAISMKRKLVSWLDLFAAYKLATPVFVKEARKGERELPGFRQFQVGLNFILGRVVNYQY